MGEHVHRRETADLSLVGRVAQALRERAPQRYFMIEQYGRDGEILEASEGHPIAPDHEGVHAVIITGVGFAEPRRDWRERGMLPPRGFHPSQWRK
jgi:hypothetical protein